MADVFISYSRKDKEFVQVLHQALVESKYDAWIDWQDIPPTADWWAEIEAGIEAADAFIFVISPDSVISRVCNREIEHAVNNHKRIVPVVRHSRVNSAEIHKALRQHNWLYFRKEDDFQSAFLSLVDALNLDLAYTKHHTRLLVKALEWERKQRRDDLLLRGKDLEEAELWLTSSLQSQPEPAPTEQHITYIHKSREVEIANHRLVEAGEKAKRLVRVGTGILASALALASIVSVMTFRALRELREAKVSTRLQQDSTYVLNKFSSAPLDALLLAVENGKELQNLVGKRALERYPTTQPLVALRTILDNIHEKNQIKAHDSAIWSMDVSPTQELIATTDAYGNVKIWNFSGEKRFEITLEPPHFAYVKFSPDGKRLLMREGLNNFQVWDTESWQMLFAGEGNQANLAQTVFSSSGDSVIGVSRDGKLTRWDDNGRQLESIQITPTKRESFKGLGIQYEFNGSEGLIDIINIFRDSPAEQAGLEAGDQILSINDISLKELSQTQISSLLSGSSSKFMVVRQDSKFEVSLQPTSFFIDNPIALQSIKVSPLDDLVASGGDDGIIRFFSFSDKAAPPDISAHSEIILNISFSPTGEKIATTSGDEIKLWDTYTGKQLASLKGHESFITHVEFSSDGQYLVTAGADGASRVWNLAGQSIVTLKGHNNRVNNAYFGQLNNLVITAGRDGTLRLWQLPWLQRSNLQIPDFSDVQLEPKGRFLSVADFNGGVNLWDFSGKHLVELDKHDPGYRIFKVNVSPDGDKIATTTAAGNVYLWTIDGEKITSFRGSSGSIVYVEFSPDGQTLLTTSLDSTANLWDLQGKLLKKFEGHNDAIWDGSFSPDGKHILTGSNDGTARLWAITGETLAILEGHKGVILAVLFSPDGQTFATAGADGTVRLWDLAGNALAELRGHQDGVNTLSFSPDGLYLATASLDKTTRIWTITGQQIAEFRGAKGGGGFATFNPNGQSLIMVGENNRVHAVPFEPAALNDLLQRGCTWLEDYLAFSPTATEDQKTLCKN